MAEKQLTVAELMARAQKEGRSGEPRRRRRRSAEEGGVSLAELTGSIPRVPTDASAPAHTHATAGDDADAKAETKVEPKVDAKPEAKPEVKAETKSEAKTDAKTEQSKTELNMPWGVIAVTEVTQVTQAVEEDAKPETKTETKAEPKVEAKSEPKTEAKPEPKPEAKTEPKTEVKAAVTAPAKPKPTKKSPAVEAVLAAKEAAAKEAAEKEAAEKAAAEAAAKKAEEQAEEEVQPISFFDPEAIENAADGVEEEHKTSALAVGIMAIVGIIIGVVFFRGFMLLWEHFNPFITAILALAVTCGTVGVVHALHTERRRLTMVIAGIAALIVTVGPYWA
ncbi:MAG: hypothetical protein Q3972_08095 [Corynebacterium sp.]|nr:hypothetical protein [Corynebacterium sp.]